LWSKKIRENTFILFIISVIVNLGMWLERFVIVVISLHRDFLPSSWRMYYPTRWDWATYLGTLGLFFTLLYLFLRVLPAISMSEMRVLVVETDPKRKH
jgi:molybdopterin-containing oxidoreductase family membrane subunit